MPSNDQEFHLVKDILTQLSDAKLIRPIDIQFAKFIQSIENQHSEEVAFIAALLSYELSKGNICLRIDRLNAAHLLGVYGEKGEELKRATEKINWRQVLSQASVVGDENTDSNQPLILDGSMLYLQRYWYYEQFLANKLRALAEPIQFTTQEQQLLSNLLEMLFPDSGSEKEQPNWQKVAVAVALTRRLSVISGGPGTGKTTTVVKLLSALIEQGRQKNKPAKISLVAPTGKAAARLTESIGSAVKSLAIDPEIRAAIPTQASTIHRLLGARPDSAEFRHNQDNPLHLDLLVVDEASMVDLPMMAKLLDALPERARLILLGDKDQLSSVEAGAVLGDICSFIGNGYSPSQAALLAELTGVDSKLLPESVNANPLSDSLCLLRKSYRFHKDSGIGVLANAINLGLVSNVSAALDKGYKDIVFHELTAEHYRQMIGSLADNYSDYLSVVHSATKVKGDAINTYAVEALRQFSQCRLLCAVRDGEFGITRLNQQVEHALTNKRLIQTNDEHWYLGRPIMITRNDHALGLFNGDIGITMLVNDSDEKGQQQSYLKVFFELPDGRIKSVLPSRIPDHDTAYAMTIHKSQGSEFTTTMMVLPAKFSPLLTKELVYTGVTRAKDQLHIYANREIILKATQTKTERLSGLKEKLVLLPRTYTSVSDIC